LGNTPESRHHTSQIAPLYFQMQGLQLSRANHRARKQCFLLVNWLAHIAE
jgi:hypothetical protein